MRSNDVICMRRQSGEACVSGFVKVRAADRKSTHRSPSAIHHHLHTINEYVCLHYLRTFPSSRRWRAILTRMASIQVTGIAEATTEQHLTDFFTYVVSHLHNQIHLSLRALLRQVLRQDHLRSVRPLGAYSHPQLREAFRRQDRAHAQRRHPRRCTPHHHQRHRAPGQGRQCPRRSHRPDRQAPRRQ